MATHRRTEIERRIWLAIQGMPYQRAVDSTALDRTYRDGDPITLAELAPYLESLRTMLVQVALDEAKNERDLAQMRSDLKAAGRVFKAMGLNTRREATP